jgi:TctA family transporter
MGLTPEAQHVMESLLVGLFTAGVAWGALKGEMHSIRERISRVENSLDNVLSEFIKRGLK